MLFAQPIDMIKKNAISYLIVHIQAMVGNNKAFEAGHVGIWTFPGQKKRVRPNMTQLEAADRRQRTEF